MSALGHKQTLEQASEMSAKCQEQTVPKPRGFWPWRRLVCVRGRTQGDLALVYSFGARRIRPGARQGTAWEPGTIGNTDYVAAGVSVKVGVDADEGELVHLETGL